MKHPSEEQLIEMYYGESPIELASHLRLCRECSALYARLQQDLADMKPAAVPERNAHYGEQVWQALRPSLPAYEKREPRWQRFWNWQAAGLTAACALLIASAFLGGRYWERYTTKPPAIASSPSSQAAAQRVMQVVLRDHLDRTERLLVALEHTDPGDTVENVQLQTDARDLLASNRLYRTTASQAGDPALAGALDRLEGVLAEVANGPTALSSADLRRVREEMNTEGILFEIRVLRSRTAGSTGGADHNKGVSI
jgi:hypothetical protein